MLMQFKSPETVYLGNFRARPSKKVFLKKNCFNFLKISLEINPNWKNPLKLIGSLLYFNNVAGLPNFC